MLKRFLIAVLACVLGMQGVGHAASDDIARLYNFTSGTVIQSSQINGEFDQLITDINTKAGRAVNQTLSGANTFSGSNTFSGTTQTFSNTTGVTTNTVTERTVGNGVTVGGLLTSGGYASQPGYLRGCMVDYSNSDRVTINSTCAATDSTNAVVIVPSGTITVDIAASGANGLDTGSQANSTWYYVWLIRNPISVTVAGMFSTSSTSPTMPSGYVYKRLLPFAVKNDGSGNFIPFYVRSGWPYRPTIGFRVNSTDFSGVTAGTTNILNGGTADNAAHTISAAAFVPPISKLATIYLRGSYGSAARSIYMTQTGSGLNGTEIRTNAANLFPGIVYQQDTDGSQQVDYKISGANSSAYADVLEFTVTEVP